MLTILIRSLLLVGVAVLTFRLMGKRQVGQLQPFELVIAIMIADLAATPMESLDIPLWRGVAPMLALITFVFSLLAFSLIPATNCSLAALRTFAYSSCQSLPTRRNPALSSPSSILTK